MFVQAVGERAKHALLIEERFALVSGHRYGYKPHGVR